MSFTSKVPTIDSQYRKLLSTQNNLIKTNKYVRELEEKYNKSTHKYSNLYLHRKTRSPLNTHLWPIESKIFTNILKNKLDSELSSRPDYFHSRSKIASPVKSQLSNVKLRPIEEKSFQNESFEILQSSVSVKPKRTVSEIPQITSPIYSIPRFS